MQFLRRIFDFYLFSNIHVALSGFCLTKVTLFSFNIENSLTPYFVAFSIIVSYNFIRFFEIKNNRLIWFKDWFYQHKNYLIIQSLLAVLGIGFILFSKDFNFNGLKILLPFGFMTLFYVVPLFKIGSIEVSFRNFPFVKIFSIAIAWAGITVFFPLYEISYSFTMDVFVEFIQRFLFLIVIIIPFDIRDVSTDEKSLKTLPQLLGIKKVKLIGYFLLLWFVGIEFLKSDYSNSKLLVIIGVAGIAALFLKFATSKQSRYYTGFWVESIPIIWFVFFILFLKK